MSDQVEPSTQDLLAATRETRAQVADDVERLANALAPARLKTRAMDAAVHSGAHLLERARQQLARSPRWLVSYLLRHPVVGMTVLVGAAAATWKLAAGRRR